MLLAFGKKRRSKRSSTKKSSKGRKPPSKLLKMCKKYKVKVTIKRGSKRVYKKASLLKKLCLKKKKALNKKKKVVSRKKNSTRFGAGNRKGARGHKGAKLGGAGKKNKIGSKKKSTNFGKGRRVRTMSKKAAMKAFRAFYAKHCKSSIKGRRTRSRFGFGSGGNPPLMQSMGYEFDPTGKGGVLGMGSTGLFPTPAA
jgi:hypothetical protein